MGTFVPVNTASNRFTPVEAEQNKLLGTARSGLSGMTLGWSDEIGSLLAAATVKATGDETDFWDIYDSMVDAYKVEQDAFEEQNPKTALAAEFAGGLATGGVGATKTAALQGGKRILGLAGLGGAFGAGAGAGSADRGEKVEGALSGGTVGTAIGAAIPLAGSAIGDLIKRIIGKYPVDAADRKLLQAIQRDGKTPQKIKDTLSAWGEGGTILDASGESTLKLATAAKGVPGKAGDKAERFLQDRMKGEYSRIMHSAKKLLGSKGEYFKSIKNLEAERKVTAKPLYDEAYRTSIEITPELEKIFARPSVKTALKKAINKARNEGLEIAEDVIDTRRIDYTKRALDDMIDSSKGKDAKRVLIKTKNEILEIVDAQNPVYKQARNVWSDSKQLQDAVENGAKFLRGDSDMVAADIANLTEGQREFFRIGALRSIRNTIARTRDTNSISQKFENPAMRERLKAVFPDDESYNGFIKEVFKESRYAEVRNKVLRGSQTAEKLEAQIDFGRIPSIATDAAQGNIGRTGVGIMQGAMDYLKRPNPKVAERLMEKMTDPDLAATMEYLSTIEKSAQINPMYKKLIDSMAGAGAIQAGL